MTSSARSVVPASMWSSRRRARLRSSASLSTATSSPRAVERTYTHFHGRPLPGGAVDPASRREDVEHDGPPHAAPGAHAPHHGPPTTAALLMDEGHHHAGAGHRHGVTEAATAADRVDDLLVEAEQARGAHAHRGERLVDLPQVDVADREAGPVERLGD